MSKIRCGLYKIDQFSKELIASYIRNYYYNIFMPACHISYLGLPAFNKEF